MTDRLAFRLALGAALVPFAIVAVVLIATGGDYVPISDHALIEMKLRDIGEHPVWTGLYSRNDWSHPGPLFFYLLWPIYAISGSASISVNVGALLLNGASIVGIAVVARRRGGTPLAVVSLAACALLIRTLGVDFVSDPWNTYVTVLPFALLVFLCWAMACGETWALPVAAVTATFLAQTHVGFLVLALPLFAVGAGWLVWTRRRDVVRPVAWTAGLLVLLWLPLLGATDNLRIAYRWFGDAEDGTKTILQGWRVATGQLAMPPEWLTTHREPSWLTGEHADLFRTPIPWVLLLVGAAAWWFRRRDDGDGLRLLAVAGVTFVLAIVAVWRTVGLAFDYRLRWVWVIGLLSAVVVGRAAATWQRRATMAVAVAALVGATVVNAVVATRGETPRQADGELLADLLPAVLDQLGDADAALVTDGTDARAIWYTRSLVLQLERRGIDARMPVAERFVVGEHRTVDDDGGRPTFLVAVDDAVADRDADPTLRRIALWSSVTDEQVRDFEALDERLEREDVPVLERALTLREHGLDRHHQAVAWRVAVYVPEIPT